jgi:importin subunit beta-1
MDARQVLQSTLAPDAAERTNAEQQLAHAAEVDFVRFTLLLPQALLEKIQDLDANIFVI